MSTHVSDLGICSHDVYAVTKFYKECRLSGAGAASGPLMPSSAGRIDSFCDARGIGQLDQYTRERIDQLLAEAPPLTQEQREQLRLLLEPEPSRSPQPHRD